MLASLNNITCPIKTQRAKDIIDRTKRGLLKERIGQNVLKIGFLKRDSLNKEKLSKALRSDRYEISALDNHINS